MTRSAPGWPQGAAGPGRTLREEGPKSGLPATAEAEERRFPHRVLWRVFLETVMGTDASPRSI